MKSFKCLGSGTFKAPSIIKAFIPQLTKVIIGKFFKRQICPEFRLIV